MKIGADRINTLATALGRQHPKTDRPNTSPGVAFPPQRVPREEKAPLSPPIQFPTYDAKGKLVKAKILETAPLGPPLRTPVNPRDFGVKESPLQGEDGPRKGVSAEIEPIIDPIKLLESA